MSHFRTTNDQHAANHEIDWDFLAYRKEASLNPSNHLALSSKTLSYLEFTSKTPSFV